ncbi:GNAT family N-acetyltransferase [Paenibacillus sp. FSL H7-0714]|uniref:GNAT family N-acetyltransferase n=1 Tax=Paenibacillus sp. FSL H7-0714 TaxID=2954735 RepID=UPI0030F9A65A
MIETKRCRLIGLQEIDFEDLKKLYSNHQVRKYLGGATDDEILLRNKFNDVLKNSTDAYYWVIRSINDNQFIGLVTLTKYHDGLNIEVSYQFLPEWWGSGLATEVIKTIIEYSFNELGLSRLVAETQTANIASCRLLERVGMKLECKLYRFNAEQSFYSIKRQV